MKHETLGNTDTKTEETSQSNFGGGQEPVETFVKGEGEKDSKWKQAFSDRDAVANQINSLLSEFFTKYPESKFSFYDGPIAKSMAIGFVVDLDALKEEDIKYFREAKSSIKSKSVF